jgi:hypothetical protein
MGNSLNPTTDSVAAGWLNQASSEHKVYQATVISKGGAHLKVNDRGLNHSVNGYEAFVGGRFGIVGHDGSYNFFEWDHTKRCMVPFKLSIGFSIRRALPVSAD